MKHWLKIKHRLIIPAAILIVAFSSNFTLAETTTTPSKAASLEEQGKLEQELREIQAQIDAYQQQLSQVQGQKKTLQNKLTELKKQQSKITLQIQVIKLQMDAINDQLYVTGQKIVENTSRIEQLRIQTKNLIGAVYQNDSYSLLDVLLSQDNLSDFLTEMESYTQISTQLHDYLTDLGEANHQLTENKQELANQQDESENLLAIQSLQQTKLADTAAQQSSLLTQTKGVEANYQSVLNNTQALANQIRGRLYQLLGVSTNITFGEALKIAQWASSQTGVRAAFLLAILTQESNLGKNVGTCNRAGDPPSKSYKVVMKPDRDIPPFLQITSELGLNPDITPVSCPMHDKAGNQVGYGGAMGPAQFIPSTWIGYKDKVAAVTGKSANPWDIRDAFLASAIKLKAGGAGTVDGEWAAAMRYFSGGTNVKYRFYGDNVVATANQYQADIDNLNK